ncbi:endonuclease III [bacterium]|nr:endonuclease III [bacterium]
MKKETFAGIADMKAHIARIRDILVPLWPDARPLLSYANCFELLCAVMMSAQTTDEQVNAVTPALFARYPDAEAMASAEPENIEPMIHSIGFFHTKARHLVQTARILSRERGGAVPATMEGLLELPGVGRKTANLVASACFGAPGIIVDTHVARSAVRLGLYAKKDPDAIEAIIRENLDPEDHTAFSHALNRHGKFICTARAPACVAGDRSCPLEAICPKYGL